MRTGLGAPALALLAVLQIGIALSGHAGVVVFTVLAGIPIGLNNTVFTESAMAVSDAPRPVASTGYNLVRWTGGAPAPFIATKLGEEIDPGLPYWAGAARCAIGMAVLVLRRRHLRALVRVDADHAVLGVRPAPAP